MGSTMRALADAPTLPERQDQRVAIPPTGHGYVRRVGNLNLWVHFTFNDVRVFVRVVVTVPPVPADE